MEDEQVRGPQVRAELLRRLLVAVQVMTELLAGEAPLLALEQVMNILGYGKEGIVGLERTPLRIDAHAAHNGDKGPENLSNATPIGSGVNVDNPASLKTAASLADLAQQSPRCELSVVSELPSSDGYVIHDGQSAAFLVARLQEGRTEFTPLRR